MLLKFLPSSVGITRDRLSRGFGFDQLMYFSCWIRLWAKMFCLLMGRKLSGPALSMRNIMRNS